MKIWQSSAFKRRGERDRSQIRAAPAQRRDCALGTLALEAGYNHNVILGQQLVDLPRRNVRDFRFRVHAVGHDPSLRAAERDRFAPERIHRHRRKGARALFAGREERIHLALVRLRRQLARQFDQAISHSRHRGNDRDHIVARPFRREQTLRHPPDAFRAAD